MLKQISSKNNATKTSYLSACIAVCGSAHLLILQLWGCDRRKRDLDLKEKLAEAEKRNVKILSS